MVGRVVTAESVVKDIARDSAFFDESNGGVTFSGGEPLAQPDFLAELLDLGSGAFFRSVLIFSSSMAL